MKDVYVVKGGKKLRCGYTTGSCAAAAAKAAAIGLLNGNIPEYVEIETPAGVGLRLNVRDPKIEKDSASCCIIKDAGDDPDVTDGMAIYAQVSRRQDDQITIDGGEGIGRITREGFWGKVGEAAINPVPRRMIRSEVEKVVPFGADVLIYAPLGKEIAKKTFNASIGIEGGISVIGTTGIVEPMSEEALIKSICLELDAIYEKGIRELVLFPGNYGKKMVEQLKVSGEKVKISNYIGEVLLYCYYKGFQRITLVGNIGKLCKLSIGIFNTHSKIADARLESFVYYLAMAQAPYKLLSKVQKALTAEEAVEQIIHEGYGFIVEDMGKGCEERIRQYLKDEQFDIRVVIYSMRYGVLFPS